MSRLIKQNRKVDIELLLEAIEKLENRDDDTLPLFYKHEKKIISQIDDLYLKTDKKILLSDIVKRFIKSETGKVDIQVGYLNGMLELMEYYNSSILFYGDRCWQEQTIPNDNFFY